MKVLLRKFLLLPLLSLPMLGQASLFDAKPLDAQQFILGGPISPAERHLDDLLRRPEANAILLSLIDDPARSPVAKLYALCGLKRLGSGGYEAALGRVRGLDGQVSVLSGDQMLRQDIRQVAERIEHQQCDEGS